MENNGIGINGEYPSPRFADGILIFTNSHEEMKDMLAEASINARLKINLEKIKALFNSFAPKKKIVHNNTEIKELQCYMYLRQEITSDNSIMNNINRRT